ncbi:MAG TPA: hypothetical protein VF571_21010 [Pyrinomonadaceae bacterium]|jgi:hypothetical protein
MKISNNKELTIQISILIICAVSIALQIKPNAKAQTTYCQSPLYTDRNPTLFSLVPGVQYDVRIDSAWEDNTPEKNAIQIGVSKWNNWSYLNCSNISFRNFASKTFTNYDEDAPAGIIYWQRKDPQNGYLGATFHYIDAAFYRTVSARIQIVPRVTNTNSIFQYFGSHETGHLYGLANVVKVVRFTQIQ